VRDELNTAAVSVERLSQRRVIVFIEETSVSRLIGRGGTWLWMFGRISCGAVVP
jgi:hypothetical protein